MDLAYYIILSFLETHHLGLDDSLLPMPVKRLGRSLTGQWRTSSSPDGLILGFGIPVDFTILRGSAVIAQASQIGMQIGQKDSSIQVKFLRNFTLISFGLVGTVKHWITMYEYIAMLQAK